MWKHYFPTSIDCIMFNFNETRFSTAQMMGIILLVAIAPSAFGAQQSDGDMIGIEDIIDSLFRVPIIDQSELDSCTALLRSMIEVPGLEGAECHEIKRIRAIIAVGCMFGGSSNMLTSILDAEDECTPEYGGFNYCLGNIHFLGGNFEQSAKHFAETLAKIGDLHYLAPNAQLNLAAALHKLGRTEEAIEGLLRLAEPNAAWRDLEGFPEAELDAQIRVNAASMILSTGDYTAAIETLNEIDENLLDSYWKNLTGYNLYLAYAVSGRFVQADSIWLNWLQFLPPEQVPLACYDAVVEAIIAQDNVVYLASMRDLIASQLRQEEFANLATYDDLLDPALDSADVARNWSLIRRHLAHERVKIQNVRRDRQSNVWANSLKAMQANLDQESRRSTRFQWLVGLLSVGFAGVLVFRFYQIRAKRRTIEEALIAVEASEVIIDDNSKTIHPNLKILPEETRVLSEALIRGRRIGEALMVVRKLEAIYQMDDAKQNPLALDRLPNFSEFTGPEKVTIRLTLMNIPTKEIAHQLRVSPGHVYNLRSSIRQKLDMPNEVNFAMWISEKLEANPEG